LKRKRGGRISEDKGLIDIIKPFPPQFREGVAYRRLGLLNCNRFGEYFFNNEKSLAIKAIKAEALPTMESKAAGSGRTLVEVQRDERYKFSKAEVHDRPYQQRPKNNKPPNQSKNKPNCTLSTAC
jgi:hypothetical protein